MSQTQTLSAEQIEEFVARGFLTLHDCFSREIADQWIEESFQTVGLKRHEPTTWAVDRITTPGNREANLKEFSPKAWAATCELLGGEPFVKQPCKWRNSFIVNLRAGADKPWQGASAASDNWHNDGDWFRHYLDSPEQGLLTFVLWSDIEPRGGGTFIAPDSIGVIARYLLEHPAGKLLHEMPFRELVKNCREFVEVTGKVGDVILLHPLMLHAFSQNHSGRARSITNPTVQRTEPLQFHRADGKYTPVEQATLRALNVEKLDFAAHGSREVVVPDRIRKDREVIEAQRQAVGAV